MTVIKGTASHLLNYYRDAELGTRVTIRITTSMKKDKNNQIHTNQQQPATNNHQPTTINHKPSTTNQQPSAINHQPPTISHQLPTINHHP